MKGSSLRRTSRALRSKEFIGTLKDTDVIFLILEKNNPIRRRNKGSCYARQAELSGANWVEVRLLYKDRAVGSLSFHQGLVNER